MKKVLLAVLVMLVSSFYLEGCHGSSGSSGGSGGPWQPFASVPDDGVRYQGFGMRNNGEVVLAGGHTSTGQMTSEVIFYQVAGAALNPLRTAYLPEVMIKPAVEEINGALYIFDGGYITSKKPNPVRNVYRYDEVNNAFITESPDPGFFFYNHAGTYQNKLFSLNPPEPPPPGAGPGTPITPASLQLFAPGSGWMSQQLQDFPQTGTVAVIGSTAYAFNGTILNVGQNTDVYAVNLNTGTVTQLPITTQPRDSGSIALVVSDTVHVHGLGLDFTPEVFDPATNQVTVRPDLAAPVPLDWPIAVHGSYIFLYNSATMSKTIYAYRP